MTKHFQALAVFCGAAAVFAWVAQPPSDHPDFLREWLAAQDCLHLGHCWLAGSASSFQGLHNGTLLATTFAWLQRAGGTPNWAWSAVIGADAAAITLLWQAVPAAKPGARALAAALCMAPIGADLAAGGLWAPGFLPLFCSISVTLAAAVPADARGARWGAALGVSLALAVDAHVIGVLAVGSWLAVLVWQRRFAAAALAVGVAAAGAWLLAPAAQLENVRIGLALAREHWVWLAAGVVFFAGGTVAFGACENACRAGSGCWLARTFAPLQPTSGPLNADWLAGALPFAALALAAGFTGRGLEARYWVVAVPPLAIGLANSAWCARRPFWQAAVATGVLASVIALSAGKVSLGHRWSVVEAAAKVATDAHLGWPEVVGAVQGHGCRRLAAGILASQVGAVPAGPHMGGAVVQVIDLPNDITAVAGWRAVPLPLVGGPPTRSWVRQTRPWLSGGQGQACLRTAATGERCTPLQPGVQALGSGAAPPSSTVPRHMWAYPRLVAWAPPMAPSTTSVTLQGMATGPATRWLRVLDLPRQRCPWRLESSEGFQVRIIARDWYELRTQAAGRGSVTFARSWGPGCDPVSRWTDGPPCLLEVEADSPWLAQLVVP